MSSSFGPPGWVDPASSTAPDPALALKAPPPAPETEPVAEPAAADPDVYVRPARRELPEWTPPAGTAPAFTATTTLPPGLARVPEDRRWLDGRRVRAYFIDSILIGAIPTLLTITSVVTEGAMLIFVALQLIYYFLCEVTTGQTVGKSVTGLRVVALDGTPATAKAISARTVTRVLEQGLIGLIIMCLSGRRRRRLGDFLGGTVVVEAMPDPGRPPKSVLTVVYPVAWLASAIAFFGFMGHGGDAYLAEVDLLCKEANAVVAGVPAPHRAEASVAVAHEELALLQSIRPADGRRAVHAEIVGMKTAVLAETRATQRRIAAAPGTTGTEMQRLAAFEAPLQARYAQLGLKHCAR